MPDIKISGYTTHYEDHDFSTPWVKSEVVLIQHGFGRNANFWFQWVPKIANDFRLIRRDLRGHGGTTDPENLPWSFDRLVDDMRDFCDALDLEAIHLIGESTGGMLSVGFAHRYPDRVKSLTLCNSPTTIDAAGQRFFAGSHSSWQAALEDRGAKGWTEWLVDQPGTAVFESPEERAWVLKEMARTSTKAMISYSQIISNTDVAPMLRELTVPTLVLAPTRSGAAPLDGQRKMASALPNGFLAVIDSKAHEVYWDCPDECVTAWRDHVTANS